jgi:putative transposase
MARIARVVVPGYPHHVTQRGSRRQATFFREKDYQNYLTLMAQWCRRQRVSIWAYCLMPNHVHLVAVPETAEGLARAIGQAHRQHALMVNAREGWSGHLWQERFASFVMDESYLMAAVRYVELNPVRAGLTPFAEDYPWSSARAHLHLADDILPRLEVQDDMMSLALQLVPYEHSICNIVVRLTKDELASFQPGILYDRARETIAMPIWRQQ